MNKGFTVQEQEELNKASNALNLDVNTKKLAFTYFVEYKQKIKQATVERLSLMMNCAIFAASKSQVITTVKGDTIRGVGISVQQLLRNLDASNRPATIHDFLMGLKEFINFVTLPKEILTELKAMIDKFAFSYTFSIKFNTLLRQLDLEQPMSEHEEYLKSVKKFGWLLFTNARASILQNRTELIESVLLLAATLNHIVVNLPRSIPLAYFEKINKDIYVEGTNKKNEEAILAIIMDLLKLNKNSLDEVHTQQKALKEFVKKMNENGVLRSSEGSDSEGLYEAKDLLVNLEKLDAYYQKKLSFDDIDERFFDSEKKTAHAGMFTPFAKQGAANKFNININITRTGETGQSSLRNFPSQKMFNVDASESVSLRSNLNDIRNVDRSIPASPLPFNKMPPATPMTRALEMYSWLNDKTKTMKNESGLTPNMERHLSAFESKFKEEILTRASSLIVKVLEHEKEVLASNNTSRPEQKTLEKQVQMESLYLRVLEELLNQEERKTKNLNYAEILSTEEFHRALIACSIETVFFIQNNSNVTFVKLLEICEIQPLDFWKIISSFAKFDPQMPLPLKKHLHVLELKILMNLAWKKESAVHKIIEKFMQEEKTSGAGESATSTEKSQKASSNTEIEVEGSQAELTHSQELFFKRVLHHCALNIFQLSEGLGLRKETAEEVWNAVKYILSSETTLLINRHVDQIILSTIYGVCKVLNEPFKFQEIIVKYQELPYFDKDDFFENIHQVYINENEKGDLIKFYNTAYIAQMKVYLYALSPQPQLPMRPGTPQIKKPLVAALITNSPLRESLPQYMAPIMAYRSVSAHSKTKNPIPAYGMTPRTGALYAFGESPYRELTAISTVASKRQISFDDGPETNVAGEKKLKTTNSILDKIVEQKNEDSELDGTKLGKSASKINLFSSAPTQSPILNKFSSYEEGSEGPKVGFSLPKLLQNKSNLSFQSPSATKMNLENGETGTESPQQKSQQIGQSQSQSGSPTQKSEQQVGFKKVQKQDGSITPEFNKKQISS